MLKEVQHIPSGLALLPSSKAVLTRLEDIFVQGIGEEKFLGAQGIEKAQNLDTYIITSLPHIFTTLDKNDRLVKEPITPELVLKELKEENGFYPTVIVETK